MSHLQASDAQHPRLGWTLGVLCVVAIAAAAVVSAVSRHAHRKTYSGPVRHVVVISLDTTRADHFGCYGNTWIRTPRIDELAAESILFTDYMTVIPTTLASHTSLFTGKYPHTHGVPRNGFVVHGDNVMLAEILREAGFRTVGFLASFVLEKRFNFDQGFDHFDQEFDILVGEGGADQNQRRADSVTNAVIDYLDERELPANLFLFVHYFDPHLPYDPPPPYDRMYGDAEGAIRLENHPGLEHGAVANNTERFMELYAGEVSYMDHHVGRLLDYLRRRDILDEALLVLTSDHGEHLGDNKQGMIFDHGWSTYQSEMHAVGMIRLPNALHGGTRLDLPVASIDVLPTVVSYLGLPTPAEVEGEVIDLTNLTGIAADRIRFGEASKPWEQVEIDPAWFNNLKARCARQGRFKYIRTFYQRAEELYDLSLDPHERTNLLAERGSRRNAEARKLRRALRDWKATQDPLPTHFDRSHYEDTVRRLKALGYLSTDDD